MPLNQRPLAGKCAIVTGASRGDSRFAGRLRVCCVLTPLMNSGIGKAIALELADRGADVLITYASKASSAEDTVSAMREKGVRAAAVRANAYEAEQACSIVVEAARSLADGYIDIIVNNAADGSDQDLDQVNTALFDRIMHANVLFPMLLVKASKTCFRKGTRVINISSTGARSGELYLTDSLACQIMIMIQAYHSQSSTELPKQLWKVSLEAWLGILVSTLRWSSTMK